MNILKLIGFMKPGGVDADAQAFITAAGITDGTQKSAINTLVKDLKGYNIWSKLYVIYPFVGGTATTHKFNLKDPRDLDAAFRIVWNGSIVHSSTGVKPTSASTANYGDTFFNPQTQVIDQLNGSVSVYVPSFPGGGSRFFIGASTGNYPFAMAVGISQGGSREGVANITLPFTGSFNSWGTIAYNTTFLAGFLSGGINGGNVNRAYLNGSYTGSSTDTFSAGTIAVNSNVTLFKAGTFPASEELRFASLGIGLSDSEYANFYTAVQAFQTTLGRQV